MALQDADRSSSEATVVARPPKECSSDELAAFVKIAAKGNEVEADDIKRGVERAAIVAWFESKSSMHAVAALKMPYDSYKERVFRKAGIPEESQKFGLELGYVYVEEAKRGNGYGAALVKRIIETSDKSPVYATTRSDNDAMQAILRKNGFASVGSAYTSERNPSQSLMLFARL